MIKPAAYKIIGKLSSGRVIVGVINDYIETFKKAPYWMYFIAFIALVCIEFFNNPGFNTFFWNPPKSSALLKSEGFFTGIAKPACHPAGNCFRPSYDFQTTSDGVLELNCEPSPPMNKCLKGYAASNLGSPSHPVKIEYLMSKGFISQSKYNIIMSISDEKNVIVDYNHRLAEIRGTYWFSTRSSSIPPRRVVTTQVDILFFAAKETIFWGFFFLLLVSKITATRQQSAVS